MNDIWIPAQEWPPYDPVTETNGGWYIYQTAMLDLEREDRLFTEEWRADEEFLSDYFHTLEKMYAPEDRGWARVQRLIVRRMLDCMKRDHVPYDGPIKWHPTGVTQ
jgi:hypothetical protein